MLRRCVSVSTAAATASSGVVFRCAAVIPVAAGSLRRQSTTGPTPPPPPPPPSAAARRQSPTGGVAPRFTDEEIRDVVRALEESPEIAVRVVNSMSPAARRQLVVAGSAFEWFGGQNAAQTEVRAADLDKDAIISSKDFDVWFERALERRNKEQQMKMAKEQAAAAAAAEGKSSKACDAASASAAGAASSAADTATATAAGLTLGCLVMIGLEAGLPFVGFGFLDNAVMIMSGDVIDRSLGAFLGCSVLASAAMGNIVSGMLGMQIHGSIERLVHVLNLPVPILSDEQRKSRKVFLAGHIGGTLGIALGLSLGMLPLLFISGDHGAEKRAFDELDTNKDNQVDKDELETALRKAGIEVSLSHDVAEKLIAKYASKGRGALDAAEFHRLSADVKAHGPMALIAVKVVAES